MSGSELRQNRIRRGWSRDQLGHLIGIDAETLALWEEGSLEISCPIVLEQVLRRNCRTDRFASSDVEAEEWRARH
jgi:transcriptional regulator with XRE-family HTH domain